MQGFTEINHKAADRHSTKLGGVLLSMYSGNISVCRYLCNSVVFYTYCMYLCSIHCSAFKNTFSSSLDKEGYLLSGVFATWLVDKC